MTRLLFASLAVVALSAAPALAQGYRPAGAPTGIGAARQRPTPAEPAPAAIPGSRAEHDLSTPADPTNLDMPPTEALFDAINRGDFAAAKDAINRGADLRGRNVLGFTPLELSVDLGRNEISFLLLSLRGAEGYSVAGPAGRPNTKPTAAALRAEQQADRRARYEAAAAHRTQRVAVSPRKPELFAGNGGAPVPQAGFLGFDATR